MKYYVCSFTHFPLLLLGLMLLAGAEHGKHPWQRSWGGAQNKVLELEWCEEANTKHLGMECPSLSAMSRGSARQDSQCGA